MVFCSTCGVQRNWSTWKHPPGSLRCQGCSHWIVGALKRSFYKTFLSLQRFTLKLFGFKHKTLKLFACIIVETFPNTSVFLHSRHWNNATIGKLNRTHSYMRETQQCTIDSRTVYAPHQVVSNSLCFPGNFHGFLMSLFYTALIYVWKTFLVYMFNGPLFVFRLQLYIISHLLIEWRSKILEPYKYIMTWWYL